VLGLGHVPSYADCRNGAIPPGRDGVATVYGAAGSTAVFNENPFERRLRDIHAGTQQGQSRPIHFETVGQVRRSQAPKTTNFRVATAKSGLGGQLKSTWFPVLRSQIRALSINELRRGYQRIETTARRR
jgi:Acyl-CoA dehydrogenase, C-terminal domain